MDLRTPSRIEHLSKRSVEPAARSCWKPHSRISSPTLPSVRFSWAAYCSRPARRACRTRRLSGAFHSPIAFFFLHLRKWMNNVWNGCLRRMLAGGPNECTGNVRGVRSTRITNRRKSTKKRQIEQFSYGGGSETGSGRIRAGNDWRAASCAPRGK